MRYMTQRSVIDLVNLLNENTVEHADFGSITHTNGRLIAAIVKGLATNSVLETLILPYHMMNTGVLMAVIMTILNPGLTLRQVTFYNGDPESADASFDDGYCLIRLTHVFESEQSLWVTSFTPWEESTGYRKYDDSVDALLQQIADAMQTNTFITRINFAVENHGTPYVLFNALRQNKTLRRASWNGFQLNVNTLQAPSFIRLLKTNTTLTHIELGGFLIDPDDLLKIGRALLDTPRRRLLTLKGIDLKSIAPQLVGFPPESSTWTNEDIMKKMDRIWKEKFHVFEVFMRRSAKHHVTADKVADAYYAGTCTQCGLRYSV
jgi:hypothetical protein